MPRPARPWFRFYVEALHDRKLRRLPPAYRWLWVAILGAARQSPIPGMLIISDRESLDATDLADIAGMSIRDVEKALPMFDQIGLIEWDPNIVAWVVPRWNDRQYESDDITQRTRKHRSKEPPKNDEPPSLERSNNNGTSFLGTPPETETETELTPPNPTPSVGRSNPASQPSDHHGQHPNCRACNTNPRSKGTNQRGPTRPDPLADQRAAATDRAEAGTAQVRDLATAIPLDPESNASRAADLAAKLRGPHRPEDPA